MKNVIAETLYNLIYELLDVTKNLASDLFPEIKLQRIPSQQLEVLYYTISIKRVYYQAYIEALRAECLKCMGLSDDQIVSLDQFPGCMPVSMSRRNLVVI
jgi:hypothetical protein